MNAPTLDEVLLPLRAVRRALRWRWWNGFFAGATLGYLAGAAHAAWLLRFRSAGEPLDDVQVDCGRPDCPECASSRPN